MKRNEHPAWKIYDKYRTSILNVKYYEHKISVWERTNFFVDVSTALSTSSGLATLWLWKTPLGVFFWNILLTIAVIVATIKPFLKLSDRIKSIQEILSGHRTLKYDLSLIIEELKEGREYNEKIKLMLKDTEKLIRDLTSKTPENKSNRKLITKYRMEVNADLSNYDFYIPEENNVRI